MSGATGRETVKYFLSQVGSSLAGFLATWFIANRLGAEILGKYTVVMSLLFWLNVPPSAIGTAINKRVSEGTEPRAYLGAGHLLNAAVTAAFVALVFVFREFVNNLVGAEVATLLAALLVARSVFDAVVSSLRGQMLVAASGWLKTTERILRAAAQIALILLTTATIAGLVSVYVAALLVGTVVGAYFFRELPGRPEWRHARSLLEYGVFASLGTVRTRVFAWMDTTVMSFFAGSMPYVIAVFLPETVATVTYTDIGIYEVAWSLASVLAMVSIAIKQTLFPELSAESGAADADRVRHLVDEGLTFTGIFGIPGAFGAAVVGAKLLTIYRPVFARGGLILVLLVVARVVAAYGIQLLNAISALDRPEITFKINAAFIGLNFALNVALVSLYGWYGAAVATLVSSAFVLVVGAWKLHRLIDGLSVPYREIAYQVGAGAVMMGVVAGLKTAVPYTLATAIVLVGVGAAVYVAVLMGISSRVREKGLSLIPV